MKEFTFSEICRLKKWRLLQVFFKDFTETMCYCYLPLHFLNLVKLFSVIPPPPPLPPKKNTLIPGPNLDFLWIWQSKAVPFCENSAKLYFVAKHLGKGLNTGCWSFWVPFFCKKVPYLANFRCCPNFLDLGLHSISEKGAWPSGLSFVITFRLWKELYHTIIYRNLYTSNIQNNFLIVFWKFHNSYC